MLLGAKTNVRLYNSGVGLYDYNCIGFQCMYIERQLDTSTVCLKPHFKTTPEIRLQDYKTTYSTNKSYTANCVLDIRPS